MTIQIRPISAQEHATVGALTLAAYDQVGPVGRAYRDIVRDVAGRIDDQTTVLVAVDTANDDAVLGTVTVPSASSSQFEHAPHGDGGFRMLAVSPDAQGRGVGSLLVEAAVAHAQDHGWRRIAITSMEWMHRAHGMYERRGFVRRPDLDVRFESGVGRSYTLDLVDDVGDAFPPIGPAPVDVPMFVPTERRPRGC
jgi:GNAT superfamily N-acetyltransferase